MFTQLSEHDIAIAVASAMTVLLFDKLFQLARFALENRNQARQYAGLLRQSESELLDCCGGNRTLMRQLVAKQLKKTPGMDRYNATRLAKIELKSKAAAPMPQTKDALDNLDFEAEDIDLTPKVREALAEWRRDAEKRRQL